MIVTLDKICSILHFILGLGPNPVVSVNHPQFLATSKKLNSSSMISSAKIRTPDGDAGGMTYHRHSNGSAFEEGVVMSVRRVAARVEPKDPDIVYSRRSNGYCNGTRC